MIELKMSRAKAICLRDGVLQSELAEATGSTRTYMNTTLNGRVNPRPKRAKRIAEALKWEGDPMELFEEITLREVAR